MPRTWIRRNLPSLVWLFATPFSILFIITVTTSGQAFVQGVIGSLLLVVVSVGTGLAGDATWYRLELKLQDYFIASPVRQIAFLLGIALAGLFFSVPALVVLVPMLIWLGLPPANLPVAMLAVAAVWLFFCWYRLLGLHLYFEPEKWMAIRIVAERPSWNPATRLLSCRNSSE